jgi:hypothetical protein
MVEMWGCRLMRQECEEGYDLALGRSATVLGRGVSSSRQMYRRRRSLLPAGAQTLSAGAQTPLSFSLLSVLRFQAFYNVILEAGEVRATSR